MKDTSKQLHSPVPTITGCKRSSGDQESWDHIQDAGLRKKVQNRIAQRTYRERIKKRIEALEQFRDASTALLSDKTGINNSHQEANDSALPMRRGSCSMISPADTSPSTHQSEHLQPASDHCKPDGPEPNPREPERSPTSPCQSLPEPDNRTMLSSSDMAFSFQSLIQDREYAIQNDALDSPVWDFSEATDTANEITGPEKQLDLEDHAALDQSCQGFSRSIHVLDYSKSVPQPSLLDNSQDGQTALHIAARNGHRSSVHFLLSLGSKVVVQDRMGRTALHLAVHHKHEKVVQELLKAPGILEIQDQGGQTALHAAVATEQEHVVADLLAAGADSESKDSIQRTPLHLAASKGSDAMLKLLVSGGADINSKIGFLVED